MKYAITGKNIEITPSLKETSIQKLSKLEKYFTIDTVANVMMSVIKNDHKIEVTIPIRGTVVRAEEKAESMYAAIDLVMDKLERQLVKHRKKLIDRHRQSGGFSPNFMEIGSESDKSAKVDNELPQIVRSKKFAMKPMDPEEACLEMDLLGHDFFVFRNADTDEVNVVYKRKNGCFGLIEPRI